MAITGDLLYGVLAHIALIERGSQRYSTSEEAATRDGAVSRVDIAVVDPITFKRHSRNSYVDVSNDQAVKTNFCCAANRNLHN